MFTISAIDGFTLPGMMLEPGCTSGRRISASPVRGPEASSRMSLAILPGVGAQRGRDRGGVAHGLHQLNAVRALAQLQSGQLLEVLDHQLRVAGLGVEPGAHGGPADPEVAQVVGGTGQAGAVALDGVAVGGEFLAEADRGRILEVGAAGLEHVVERFGSSAERGAQAVEGRQQIGQQAQRAEPDGRGDHVVGGLRHVDVIVGVNRRVLATTTAEQLVGAVGEDLVAVHVVRRAGARLVGIHDELIAMLAGEHFIGGPHDGVGEPGLEAPRFLVR